MQDLNHRLKYKPNTIYLAMEAEKRRRSTEQKIRELTE